MYHLDVNMHNSCEHLWQLPWLKVIYSNGSVHVLSCLPQAARMFWVQ